MYIPSRKDWCCLTVLKKGRGIYFCKEPLHQNKKVGNPCYGKKARCWEKQVCYTRQIVETVFVWHIEEDPDINLLVLDIVYRVAKRAKVHSFPKNPLNLWMLSFSESLNAVNILICLDKNTIFKSDCNITFIYCF